MPVELAADRLAMLADFGVTASYTPAGGDASSITVIFDRDYGAADGGSVQFATSEPMVMCRTADVSGAAQGDAIVVGGVNFTVQVVMNDGTGMTQLMLSED
jgi:hypothetical protein